MIHLYGPILAKALFPAFEAARGREDQVTKQLRDSMDALRGRWNTLMKAVPKSEWNTPENSARWQKMYQEMRQSPAYKQNMTEYERLQKDMMQYVDAQGSRQGGPDVPHGYVWLFRRK